MLVAKNGKVERRAGEKILSSTAITLPYEIALGETNRLRAATDVVFIFVNAR